MQVKDLMRTQVTTVPLDVLVSTAYQMMTLRGSRIRHLPVVTRQNILVGILTDRDVRLAAASDAPSMAEHELLYVLEKLRVRDIMTREVVTVRGTTSLAEAGQLFLQRKFGCLPVVDDDNRLEGILTVSDLLRAYVVQATRLLQRQCGSLPVVDNGTLVGIITELDCLRAFLDVVGAT